MARLDNVVLVCGGGAEALDVLVADGAVAAVHCTFAHAVCTALQHRVLSAARAGNYPEPPVWSGSSNHLVQPLPPLAHPTRAV